MRLPRVGERWTHKCGRLPDIEIESYQWIDKSLYIYFYVFVMEGWTHGHPLAKFLQEFKYKEEELDIRINPRLAMMDV